MIQSFTIDRSKWVAGGDSDIKSIGKGMTKLLNKEGYMCCLGFFCLAAGLKEQDIIGVGEPQGAYFDSKVDLFPVAEKGDEEYINTPFCDKAVRINDSEMIAEEREEKIKEHFASVGISVEFTNEYYYQFKTKKKYQ